MRPGRHWRKTLTNRIYVPPRVSIVILFVVGLFVWELGSGRISTVLLSPPSEIASAFYRILSGGVSIPGGGFFHHVEVTLYEILASYALAIAVGVLIAFTMLASKLLEDVLEPLLYVFHAIPTIILYPMIYLIVGLGSGSKIAMGVLMGFFPIAMNTLAGIREIDKLWVSAAKCMGANFRQVALKVILPASAPVVVTGLRMGLAGCIIGVVVAEMIAGYAGIGWLIDWASFLFQTPLLYSFIVVAIIIAVSGNGLYMLLENRFVKG